MSGTPTTAPPPTGADETPEWHVNTWRDAISGLHDLAPATGATWRQLIDACRRERTRAGLDDRFGTWAQQPLGTQFVFLDRYVSSYAPALVPPDHRIVKATAVPDAELIAAVRSLRAITTAVLSGDEPEAWTKAVNARDDNDLTRIDAWLAQEGRDGNG